MSDINKITLPGGNTYNIKDFDLDSFSSASNQNIYVSGGKLYTSSASIGNSYKPMYRNGGVDTTCTGYALTVTPVNQISTSSLTLSASTTLTGYTTIFTQSIPAYSLARLTFTIGYNSPSSAYSVRIIMHTGSTADSYIIAANQLHEAASTSAIISCSTAFTNSSASSITIYSCASTSLSITSSFRRLNGAYHTYYS